MAEEKRSFNSKWELDFFKLETARQSMMCLICREIVKTTNRDDAKQHFPHHVTHTYANLQGKSRKICVENLKRCFRQQTSFMPTFVKSTNNRSEASYRVAYHLGVAGKPLRLLLTNQRTSTTRRSS